MNMSHCRFFNTANDLQDCIEALADMADPESELSPSEFKDFKRLLKLCQRISWDFSDEDEA